MERPHYFQTSSPTPQHQLNPGPSTPLPLSLISILDTRSPPTNFYPNTGPTKAFLLSAYWSWSWSVVLLLPRTSHIPFSHILLTGTLLCPVTFVIHLMPSLRLRRSLSQDHGSLQHSRVSLGPFLYRTHRCVSQKRASHKYNTNCIGSPNWVQEDEAAGEK